jgi:hypothetical protein
MNELRDYANRRRLANCSEALNRIADEYHNRHARSINAAFTSHGAAREEAMLKRLGYAESERAINRFSDWLESFLDLVDKGVGDIDTAEWGQIGLAYMRGHGASEAAKKHQQRRETA